MRTSTIRSFDWRRFNKIVLVLFIALACIVMIKITRAAVSFVAIESENGILAGNATVGTDDIFASGGKYIKFSLPPTTPPPTVGGWKGITWGDSTWVNNPSRAATGIAQDMDDMKYAGIGWIRQDMWQNIPNSHYDLVVQNAKQRGIQLTALVKQMSPANTLGDATAQANYKTWLNGQIDRYGDYIKYWEANNEPNLNWGGIEGHAPAPGSANYNATVADYVAHLKLVYETVKAKNPSYKVILGGLSEWNAEPFIDQLIADGAGRYFDIAAIHPYGLTPTDSINRYRAMKAKFAKDPLMATKPIWINEVGWNTSGWNISVPDETTKANYLSQVMTKFRQEGVTTPIFWYTLHEGPVGSSGFGLTMYDSNFNRTRFPALDAYKALQ
jgi:hypothetical protein